MLGTLEEGFEPRDLERRLGRRRWEKAGPADNCGCQPLSVVCDVGAHLEAPHAVAKDNVRGVCGNALLRQAAQDVDVLHEDLCPAAHGQFPPVLGRAGASVSNLVMPHDEKAVGS